MNILEREKVNELSANPQTENERLLVERISEWEEREEEHAAVTVLLTDIDGLSGWKEDFNRLQEALEKFKKATAQDWQEGTFEGHECPEYTERIACIWDYFKEENPNWESMFEDIAGAFDVIDEMFSALPEEL